MKARKSDFECSFYYEVWQRTSHRACLVLSASSTTRRSGFSFLRHFHLLWTPFQRKLFFLAGILLFILYIDVVQINTITEKAALKSFKDIHQPVLSLYQTGNWSSRFSLKFLKHETHRNIIVTSSPFDFYFKF